MYNASRHKAELWPYLQYTHIEDPTLSMRASIRHEHSIKKKKRPLSATSKRSANGASIHSKQQRAVVPPVRPRQAWHDESAIAAQFDQSLPKDNEAVFGASSLRNVKGALRLIQKHIFEQENGPDPSLLQAQTLLVVAITDSEIASLDVPAIVHEEPLQESRSTRSPKVAFVINNACGKCLE